VVRVNPIILYPRKAVAMHRVPFVLRPLPVSVYA